MKHLFLTAAVINFFMIVIGIAYNAPMLIILGGGCGYLCSVGYNKYVK